MEETKCPVCGGKLKVKDYIELGGHQTCNWCDSILEAISLKPLRFNAIYDDDVFEAEQHNRRKYNDNVPKCPLCGEKLQAYHKLKVGNTVVCSACDAEMEVIKVNPLRLELSENGYRGLDEDEYFIEDEFMEFDDF